MAAIVRGGLRRTGLANRLGEYDSEEMVIGFNSVYLTEVLSNLDAEDVVFELSSPNRAGVVTPQEQRQGEEIMMLIMPVMLNTYA